MDESREVHELLQSRRPEFESGTSALRVVDLFAGCGGLTLGAAQAAREVDRSIDVRLAVDIEQVAVDVYQGNFPKADVRAGSVDDYFDGALGDPLTGLEASICAIVGELDLLVGGPPCQGHSNLNNHTRRDDPKNALYARMARAAEVLEPTFVLIENVPSVKHDIGNVVGVTRTHLTDLGYVVADETVALHSLGVAQKRKRHVMLASRSKLVDPSLILKALVALPNRNDRHLAWAIADLTDLNEPTGYDKPPAASAKNKERMAYLLENGEFDLPNHLRPPCHQGEHSYNSMYGRLHWDLPAQTITSGFGSIGQGRYMHPSEPRALTPHEAARLQGFPDYFRFTDVALRSQLSTMIGNAVPPALSHRIVQLLLSEGT